MKNNPKRITNFKNILVTGGSGFIGGTIIRKLLRESNCRIFNLDKLGYASDKLTLENYVNENLLFKEKYRFLKVNLINKKEIEEAVKISDPDLVLHFAAESHVDRSINTPSVFIDSNIKGTYNLLETILEHLTKLTNDRSIKFRFVHISTDEVFGSLNEKGKFSEKTAYSPRSPYSASKAASDHLVSAWFHTYGLPVITTHCSNNYGPYQYPEKLIPLTILKAINDEEIPLYGDGKNVRDWLHVEDHVSAILKVAEKGRIGSKYCIGGHGEMSNLEVVKMICSQLDKNRNTSKSHSRLIKFVTDRLGHDRRYSIDSSLITSELGWLPKYNFENGLASTIKWYLNNLEWCNRILNKSF